MPLDLTAVRARFPALADGFAYFDNAGGSLVLRDVAERISEYLLTTSVQTGASYVHSVRASERLAASRASIARFVNAARPEEIVLGPTTSMMMRLLATSMAARFSPGDEVIVTNFDHESNIGPWHILERQGVVIKVWAIEKETFAVDLDALRALMTPRTRLVAVTHASNILGTINPVAEIAEIVHAGGAVLAVDAVAYAPHRAVDVQASGADFYAFSFYKTYGPHFAVLWGKHDQLLELDSQYHYFYGRDKVPTKLEPGNANYELAWGCTGIVDYFDELGGGTGDRAAIERAFAAVTAHEAVLGERLLSYLRDRNDVRIIGDRHAPPATRVPTIAFKVDGRRSDEIVRAVDKDRIGIRFGDFHSRRLVEDLGLSDGAGIVRVSMVHYNTVEEVDRLVLSLDRALTA
jgi:cysteine desulfurase family protein (TIGR01976 family)